LIKNNYHLKQNFSYLVGIIEKKKDLNTYKKIILIVDGSEKAAQAINKVIEFQKKGILMSSCSPQSFTNET
jgi:hypothetical protein